ncbi:hypothetical protein [Streptomyces sp. NPDC060205]|uniref:hypothetical protein n=1 Tax=Streptomyces sp. NPDC060205 TaxID=3347072 RepID=UPI0036548263
MAACAIESAASENGRATRAGCVITVDGAYAARLARSGESWFPERWTLDGPEPYAVPLPGNQPEEPGTEVLPMADGRVLIHRFTDGRHAFSLLYPTGPGTGEVPLGAVECPEPGTELRLLPPAPDGTRAYALAVGRGSTAVWLVAGGAFGPEHLAEVPGRCSGGVWLGGGDRLLALDRESQGRTKTVVVDLERGGEVSPLLQISEESNDRLLLADADSGLLLIRSDAPSPGQERLGWGVLGSTLPVRFPECLQPAGCTVTPFAIQPGLVLTPESCGVALRIDGDGGAGGSGSWLGVWRPAERHLHQLPPPEGWLTGSGRWTRDGVLHLPYATGAVPCGVATVEGSTVTGEAPGDPSDQEPQPQQGQGQGPEQKPGVTRPVPLQQAPLTAQAVASAFAGRRAAQAAGRSRGPGGTPHRAPDRTPDHPSNRAPDAAPDRPSAPAPDAIPNRPSGRASDTTPNHPSGRASDTTPNHPMNQAPDATPNHPSAPAPDTTPNHPSGRASDTTPNHPSPPAPERASARRPEPAPGTARGGTSYPAPEGNRDRDWNRGRDLDTPAGGARVAVLDGVPGATPDRATAESQAAARALALRQAPGGSSAGAPEGDPGSTPDDAPRRDAGSEFGSGSGAGSKPSTASGAGPETNSLLPALRPTAPPPTPPGVHSRPPEPAQPLRVERVSCEAPADFRGLRVGAGGGPSPSSLKVTTE